MARTKGMLNLSGNLEVNAQAPLDARTIVPTEADLTVASNFPYPYVGLEVYVTGTNKKFRLVNLDTTQSSSWQEIGEGGGGQTYNDFTGATSSTAGAHGLVPAPSAGDEGKVLFGNGLWRNLNLDLSNMIGNGSIYSTDEKLIGQWIDGKPLYQKTWTYPDGLMLSREAWNDTNIDVTSVNMDKLISLTMGGISGDTPVPYCTYGIGSASMTNKVALYTVSAGRTYHITIQYTKTTDTATAIGSANDYSTTEKIVGTWIDGKPLYQKTVTGVIGTLLVTDITNAENVFITEGHIIFLYNGLLQELPINIPFGGSSNWIITAYPYIENGIIKVQSSTNNNDWKTNYAITIRYTLAS